MAAFGCSASSLQCARAIQPGPSRPATKSLARGRPIKGLLLRTRSRLLLISSMQAATAAFQRLNTQYFVQGLFGTI